MDWRWREVRTSGKITRSIFRTTLRSSSGVNGCLDSTLSFGF